MSEEEKVYQIHAYVDGRVQGVGFRFFVAQEAEALDLFGWSRNCQDGRVEVLAQGEQEMLEILIQRLHRGPRAAFVTEVKVDWEEEPSRRYTKFSVIASE